MIKIKPLSREAALLKMDNLVCLKTAVYNKQTIISLLSPPKSGKFLNHSEGIWDKQYPENHIYFLNIMVVIYKNKYSALGIIKTMV